MQEQRTKKGSRASNEQFLFRTESIFTEETLEFNFLEEEKKTQSFGVELKNLKEFVPIHLKVEIEDKVLYCSIIFEQTNYPLIELVVKELNFTPSNNVLEVPRFLIGAST